MTIPVSLVTGFLGSGKTTLLAAMLAQPGYAGTLVVVNEFGEVGIDHDLLEASSDDTILLANGCLCCSIRGNLVDTLGDVLAQRDAGRLRAFDRVVVETSGVADPAPLLGFLLSQTELMARYRLAGVVTAVDAQAGAATLARHAEAASQVAVADVLLVTKTDLAAAAPLSPMLRALNPHAPIREVARGEVPPDLFWSFTRDIAAPGHHDHDHTGRFRSTLFQATRPIAEAEWPALLEAIRATADTALLRLKGLLPGADPCRQSVIQAAMMGAHREAEIATPRSGGARLVAISEGPMPAALIAALAGFGIVPA